MWHSIYEVEKKPEIIETIESNYRIARRVYQQLYIDISVLFADFIRSMDSFEIHDMDNDIKANEWAIKKITDVNDAEDFMTIFQTFYQITGRLPLSNGLLIIPDGDAPPGEDRVNMKNLYELFRHTNSHGLVSLPFLGLIQYYLEKSDHSLIKSTLTELYSNLSYITLQWCKRFQVSDLTANDVAIEQKKQQKKPDLIYDVIDENNTFNSFAKFWWEEDLFDKNDTQETVEFSKNILDEISQKDPFIDFKTTTETIVPDNGVITEDATDDKKMMRQKKQRQHRPMFSGIQKIQLCQQTKGPG